MAGWTKDAVVKDWEGEAGEVEELCLEDRFFRVVQVCADIPQAERGQRGARADGAEVLVASSGARGASCQCVPPHVHGPGLQAEVQQCSAHPQGRGHQGRYLRESQICRARRDEDRMGEAPSSKRVAKGKAKRGRAPLTRGLSSSLGGIAMVRGREGGHQ